MNGLPGLPPVPGANRSLALIALLMLVAALGFLAWVLAEVMLLTFAGLLMAVLLRGMCDGLGKLLRIPESWSLVVGLLLFGVILVLVVWFLGAEIVNQLDQLIPRLQKAWGELRRQVQEYDWGKTLVANTSFKVLARDREWLTRITGGLFSGTLGAIASLLFILFIALYAAAVPNMYVNGLLRLVPLGGRQRAREILAALGDTLHWWLIGTFIKMAVVGIATTVGLILLDMPLALALGGMAFLFEFVPYLGPLLAALPAVLVALAVGPVETFYVILLYLGIQTVESYVLSPLVDQRSVSIPPVLTLFSQVLLGTSSLGILGVFIATPLTAVIMVLVKMLYIEDWLGECTDVSGDAAVCVPARLSGEEESPPPGGADP